jgi:hypothetical protein
VKEDKLKIVSIARAWASHLKHLLLYALVEGVRAHRHVHAAAYLIATSAPATTSLVLYDDQA